MDKEGNVISIEEKPEMPKSNNAVVGAYMFDESVFEMISNLQPSKRGEYEITDVNKHYLEYKRLKVKLLGRGTVWLDTGTFDSLHQASSFIRTLENRTALKIGCPEEVAWRMKYITKSKLIEIAKPLLKSGYGEYLMNVLRDPMNEKLQ